MPVWKDLWRSNVKPSAFLDSSNHKTYPHHREVRAVMAFEFLIR
ncbi:MAG: hypothetical protein JWQ71_2774 [Pedosphaera sp.]|nr:hypothetical protein [Pedosphaera sp.]